MAIRREIVLLAGSWSPAALPPTACSPVCEHDTDGCRRGRAMDSPEGVLMRRKPRIRARIFTRRCGDAPTGGLWRVVNITRSCGDCDFGRPLEEVMALASWRRTDQFSNATTVVDAVVLERPFANAG